MLGISIRIFLAVVMFFYVRVNKLGRVAVANRKTVKKRMAPRRQNRILYIGLGVGNVKDIGGVNNCPKTE